MFTFAASGVALAAEGRSERDAPALTHNRMGVPLGAHEQGKRSMSRYPS
jgi:hypothetical protein